MDSNKLQALSFRVPKVSKSKTEGINRYKLTLVFVMESQFFPSNMHLVSCVYKQWKCLSPNSPMHVGVLN